MRITTDISCTLVADVHRPPRHPYTSPRFTQGRAKAATEKNFHAKTALSSRTLETLGWAVANAPLTLFSAWLLMLPRVPWTFVYAREINQGNALAAKIEDFRKHHGRLPDPDNTAELLSLGFEIRMNCHPHYKRIGDDRYELAYAVGFGGTNIIYASGDGQWRCELCC